MTVFSRSIAPLLCLSAVTLVFFARRRFAPMPARVALALRVLGAAPLVASGLVHLARPQVFVDLLPPPLPQQAWVIVATGFPELIGAAGLFFPQTRRAASLSLAVFLIAIFPANVYVAGQTVHGLPMPPIPARTTMQAAYIVLLLVAGWGLPARRA